jgi:hypothetical protein
VDVVVEVIIVTCAVSAAGAGEGAIWCLLSNTPVKVRGCCWKNNKPSSFLMKIK